VSDQPERFAGQHCRVFAIRCTLNEHLLRIDDDGALIEELPDGIRCSLDSGIHLVGFPALFDLQQGVVSDVSSEITEDLSMLSINLEGGTLSTSEQQYIRSSESVTRGWIGLVTSVGYGHEHGRHLLSACKVSGGANR
jgi:hypothetical protein